MNSCRKSHHSENVKKHLISRLNRIEGQIRGIKRMIEEDQYCDDILNQITAIRNALSGVQEELLSEHIKSCVFEQIKDGEKEVIEELTYTIRKMLK
ncbi:MAG: metal-sensitive transcriptional regulator [Brevinematia bacterium]